MIRTLVSLGAAFLMLVKVAGAPTRYDQRQEGDFNLHAQLENFLFVVAIPRNNELLTDVALQALEFKQQLSSRSASSKDQEPIKSVEEIQDEKPYTLEVVRISESHPDNENSTRKDEDAASKVSNLQLTLIKNTRNSGEAEEVGRVAKNVKNFDFPKSREVPAILGYLIDTRRVPTESKTENGGRARNVLENARNPDVDPGKPGASSKKQLFQKEEEDSSPLPSVHDNGKGPIAEGKQQELILLGDAIENCGPGRRRDAAGICQFDESAGSLL